MEKEKVSSRQPEAERLSSHMALALVSILFCLPLGVVALLYSMRVAPAAAAGNADAARQLARKALYWSLVSCGLGLLVTLLRLASGGLIVL